MKKMQKFKFLFLLICFFLIACRTPENINEVISIFPLGKYNQQVTHWINATNPNYNKPIFTPEIQKAHLTNFYLHTFGNLSPWDVEYVTHFFSGSNSNDIKSTEIEILKTYNNKNKTDKELGYGENFRVYTENWINYIAANIDLDRFTHLHYDTHNRGIAIDNLNVRALPTDDVFFYSYKIAGQGYPFDNLQMSSLWAGSPLYIVGETRDRAWTLIISADFIGWVKTSGIARTNELFINTWRAAALKHLAAITHTRTSIIDQQNEYQFTSYVGTVFPAEENGNNLKLYIPVADTTQHASIHYAIVAKTHAALMPIATTPHNFSIIMQTLIGRPYGWGNLYFYNDCSSELKSLFTPFGVWLPRNSSEQAYAGNLVDLSKQSMRDRLNYLRKNGHPFASLIYVGGHIILFVGNYLNPNTADHEVMSLTYQDMWGLHPHPPSRRAVIGKSVLFPLLEHYPEDPPLISQAGKNTFILSNLAAAPNSLKKLEEIDLKAVMYP